MICKKCVLIFIVLFSFLLLQLPCNGETLKIHDADGKYVDIPVKNKKNILIFWSIFCRKCTIELPKFYKKLKTMNLNNSVTFFISMDTVLMKKAVVNFFKTRKMELKYLRFDVVKNDKFIAADNYNIEHTPALIIVDEYGNTIYKAPATFTPVLVMKKISELYN